MWQSESYFISLQTGIKLLFVDPPHRLDYTTNRDVSKAKLSNANMNRRWSIKYNFLQSLQTYGYIGVALYLTSSQFNLLIHCHFCVTSTSLRNKKKKSQKHNPPHPSLQHRIVKQKVKHNTIPRLCAKKSLVLKSRSQSSALTRHRSIQSAQLFLSTSAIQSLKDDTRV